MRSLAPRLTFKACISSTASADTASCIHPRRGESLRIWFFMGVRICLTQTNLASIDLAKENCWKRPRSFRALGSFCGRLLRTYERGMHRVLGGHFIQLGSNGYAEKTHGGAGNHIGQPVNSQD